MRRHGSILVEVIVACGLIFMLLAVCVRMLSVTADQRRLAERRAIALQEATNLLERAGAIPYDQLDAQRIAELKLPAEASQLLPGADAALALSDEAEPVPAKRLAVELRWNSAAGRPEPPIRLTSWRYQPPAPPAEAAPAEAPAEPAAEAPAPTEPAPTDPAPTESTPPPADPASEETTPAGATP